jgi:adenylate cyclase
MQSTATQESEAPTADADGREVDGLDADLLIPALGVRDWLLSETAHFQDFAEILPGFADRLTALGVPIDRITTAIDALHSEYSGVGRFWTREEGHTVRLFPHGIESDAIYAASPFAEIHRTREWLLLDLDTTPDDRFGIVPDLKQEGYRQYLAVPIFFSNGSVNGITLATRTAGGFDARALAILRFIVPTLAAVMEIRSTSLRLDNVLRIYVGDEPHRAILAGTIRRGEVSRIRSAILFADMRGYTSLTSALTPEAAVELLNEYFDCLVPPIEAEGGEVLKYLGDGLLAIFRDRGDDTGAAAQAALTSAIGGLVRLEEANAIGRFPVASRRGGVRQRRFGCAARFHRHRARHQPGESHCEAQQGTRGAAPDVASLRAAPLGRSRAPWRASGRRLSRAGSGVPPEAPVARGARLDTSPSR